MVILPPRVALRRFAQLAFALLLASGFGCDSGRTKKQADVAQASSGRPTQLICTEQRQVLGLAVVAPFACFGGPGAALVDELLFDRQDGGLRVGGGVRVDAGSPAGSSVISAAKRNSDSIGSVDTPSSRLDVAELRRSLDSNRASYDEISRTFASTKRRLSIDTPSTFSPPSTPRNAQGPEGDIDSLTGKRLDELIDAQNLDKFRRSLDDFRREFDQIQVLTAPTFKRANENYPIKEMGEEIGVEVGRYKEQVDSYIESENLIGYSLATWQTALRDLQTRYGTGAERSAEAQTMTLIRERVIPELQQAKANVEAALARFGENAIAVSLNQSARYAELALLKSKLGGYNLGKDVEAGIANQINDVLAGKSKLSDIGDASPLGRLWAAKKADVELYVFSRAITPIGLAGQAKGMASKTLATKAKSDSQGLVPYDQSFSHKVSPEDLDLFNELSWYSRVEVLRDGLPATAPTIFTRMQKHDGKDVEFVAVKQGDGAQVLWLPREEYLKSGSVYHEAPVYMVHSDPRSMQGSSDALMAEWRAWRASQGKPVGPLPNAPAVEHIRLDQAPRPDTPEFAAWQEQKQAFGVRQFELKDIRQQQQAYADALVADYAAYLIRKEKGRMDYQVSRLEINERLETAKAVIPDNDLLTIGARDPALLQRGESPQESLGYMSAATQSLYEHAGRGAAEIGLQRFVHHGAEVDNLRFPQKLENDYPITVRTPDGTFRKISKGTDPAHPHEFLMDYIKSLHDEKGVNIAINPAYILKNQGLFSETPLTAFQLREIKKFASDPLFRASYEAGARKFFTSLNLNWDTY